MLGSLTFYRRVLHENFFVHPHINARTPSAIQIETPAIENTMRKLPAVGHGIAGIMAGWTVSFIAAPVEHIKARLQIQYSADKSKRLYSGPIDCSRKIVSWPFHDDLDVPERWSSLLLRLEYLIQFADRRESSVVSMNHLSMA